MLRCDREVMYLAQHCFQGRSLPDLAHRRQGWIFEIRRSEGKIAEGQGDRER